MSETKIASPMRTWLWLLALLVIGLGALLVWYQKVVLRQTEAHQALIAEKTKALVAAQAEQTNLNAKLSAITKEREQRENSLRAELDSAHQAQQDLTARMQSRETAHEQDLKAASEANAALKADLAQLHQAAQEAASRHEDQMRQLSADLKAEADHYRIALEGSDPEKAALLADWHQRVNQAEAELAQSRQALEREAAKLASLNEQLAAATQTKADLEQALAAAHHQVEDLNAALVQKGQALAAGAAELEHSQRLLAESQAQLQAEMQGRAADQSQAAVLVAGLRSKLDGCGQDLTQMRGELETVQGKLEHTQMAHAGTQAELERTTQAAAAKQTTLTKDLAAARDQIATLNTDFEALRAKTAAELTHAQGQFQSSLASARALNLRLGAIGGRATDQGTLLALAESDIRFRPNQAELPTGKLPSLDRIAAVLVEYPAVKVRIEGHTDSAGRDETNLVLSRKRAEAVQEALIKRGVAAERLSAEGVGAAKPIATNDNAAGRGQNRRVEIYVHED